MNARHDAELSRWTFEDLKRAREAKLEDIYKRYDRLRTEEKELHWALNTYSRTRQAEENKLFKDNKRFEENYHKDLDRLRGLKETVGHTKAKLQELDDRTRVEAIDLDHKSATSTPEKKEERPSKVTSTDTPLKDRRDNKTTKTEAAKEVNSDKKDKDRKIDDQGTQEFNSSKESKTRKDLIDPTFQISKKDRKRRRAIEESSEDDLPLSKLRK